MAARSNPPTPTLSFDDNVTIAGLLDAADQYVSNVKSSKVTQVTDQIGFTITAHDTYRPMFDVATAEHRKVNGSDAKYSAAMFCTKLTERGKVVRNEPTYVFPISNKAMATILFWEGDAEYHETALDWYLARAATVGRDVSFGNYVSFLKGYADPEGNWYTESGETTERGTKMLADAAKVSELIADEQWSSMNFKLNLEGMPAAAQLAWIDAAIHDLNALRARIVKSMSAEDKRNAKKLLDSNVAARQTIGGDRITTAMAKAATSS